MLDKYFDFNSTSPLLDCPNLLNVPNLPLNPSSVHTFGQKAKGLLEDARSLIKSSLGADGFSVVFTSSATEANNLVMNLPYHIVTSPLEHSAILDVAKSRPSVEILKLEDDRPSLYHLETILKSGETVLASLMLANNETGLIETRIEELYALKGTYPNLILHTDGVQFLGKNLTILSQMPFDAYTFSGHKIGAGLGCGVLVIKHDYYNALKPIILGGGQEKYKRSGTYNLEAIVRFANTVSHVNTTSYIAEYQSRTRELQELLESGLEKEFGNACTVWHQNYPRLTNTTFFSIDGLDSKSIMIGCDMQEICVSNGSACSSGVQGGSTVLKSLGASQALIKSAIRVSTGLGQDLKEAKNALNQLIDILKVQYKRC